MGKTTHKTKTINGVGSLAYLEVRDVPMTVDVKLGSLIDSKVIAQIEKLAAKALIMENIPVRGKEVQFLRSVFGLSQRDFAKKIGLSHVAIFKWEKSRERRLDVVNEIAVKTLVAGLLGLEIIASLDTLVGHGDIPKRLVIEYSEESSKPSRRAVA